MIRALVLLALACCVAAGPADAYHNIGSNLYAGFSDTSCSPCVWVSMDWIVPDVTYDPTGVSAGGGQGIYVWPGLDQGSLGGVNLGQTGTLSFVTSGGVKSTGAWYVLYPHESVHFIAGYPLAIGDHMHGEVQCILNCSSYLNTNMSIKFTLNNITQGFNWSFTETGVQMGMGIAEFVYEGYGGSTPIYPPIQFWNPMYATYGAGSLSKVPISLKNDGDADYVLSGADGKYHWNYPSSPFGPLLDNFNVCRSVTTTLNATASGVPQCEASTYSGASGLGGR